MVSQSLSSRTLSPSDKAAAVILAVMGLLPALLSVLGTPQGAMYWALQRHGIYNPPYWVVDLLTRVTVTADMVALIAFFFGVSIPFSVAVWMASLTATSL